MSKMLGRGLRSQTLLFVALAVVACGRKSKTAKSLSDIGQQPVASDPRTVGQEKELVALLTRTGLTSNYVLSVVSTYKTLLATNQAQAGQFYDRVSGIVNKQEQAVALELMQAVSRQANPNRSLYLLNQGQLFLDLYPTKEVVQRVNSTRMFGALSDEARRVALDPLVTSQFQKFPEGSVSKIMEAVLETMAQLSPEVSVSATARQLAKIVETLASSTGDLSSTLLKDAVQSGLASSLISTQPASAISGQMLSALNRTTANGARGHGVLLITGSCTDGLLVHISGPGLAAPATAVCSNGSFLKTLSFADPTAGGARSVTFSQTDLNGVTTSVSRVFDNDVQPPAVTLGAPSLRGVNSSAEPTEIVVSVGGGDVASLEFTTNDILKTTTGNADCEVAVSGAGLASRTISLSRCTGDGTVSVRVAGNIAVDDLGNSSTQSAPSALVTVANTPPSPPTLSSPILTASQRPVWTWNTATAVGSGTFRVKIDNSDFSSGTTLVAGPTYTPTSDLAEGAHTLYVQEKDVAGNWSSTASFPVTVDLTPPAMPSVGGGTSANGGLLTFNWSASGGGSGHFRYKLDSGNYVETNLLTYTTPTALSNGAHRLIVEESDLAGNWSSAGSYDVSVSAWSAPVLSGTTSDGVRGRGALTVSGPCLSGYLVTLTGAGLASPQMTTCTNGTFSTTLNFSNPTAGGSRSVTFSQTDGAVTTSVTRSFTNDVAPPSVSLAAHLLGNGDHTTRWSNMLGFEWVGNGGQCKYHQYFCVVCKQYCLGCSAQLESRTRDKYERRRHGRP